MYGCENWIIKKTERWRIDAFWTVVLEKTLENPLDCKEIKPVHPKGDQSGCSLEGLMLKLKLQYFGLLMWRADSFEKTLLLGKIGGRRRRGWQRMRWLDGITDSNGHRFGWTPGVGDGQGGLVWCGSWGRNELDTTEWLNWTELNWTRFLCNIDLYSIGLYIHHQSHPQLGTVFALTPSLHSLRHQYPACR